jgi:hypothetical protein
MAGMPNLTREGSPEEESMEDKDRKYLRIARRIPTGTRNLDRMREDISLTVTSVLGLISLKPMVLVDHYGEPVGNYQWRIYSVNCILHVNCIHTDSKEIVFSGMTRSIQMPHVMRVYETMGNFIATVHEIFPYILEKLNPVVEAGAVNHELFY